MQRHDRPFGPSGASILFALLVGCGTPSSETASPSSPGEAAERPPANILLITIDTLRADHLSSWGYPRETSPVLDGLASAGVRFDQAIVQWPKTGPSFASMFTSTYPSDNGIVRKVGIEVPCAYRLLAEELRDRGYSTHAVVSNGALAEEFHFDQGFDTYVQSWKVPPPDATVDPNGAGRVNELVHGILPRIDRSRPYFLWIHYLDPHIPYVPPAGWTDRFQNDEHWTSEPRIELRDRDKSEMGGIGTERTLEGRDELSFYVARYDAEISYVDHEIGRMLDVLDGEGLLEGTLTAVTSDHGESLGEHHYYFDHGRFSFQTCLRVPLILHWPGELAPRVVEEPVELLDLAPTLLEASGAALVDRAWRQGTSLMGRARGETSGEPARAFAEAGYALDGKWQRALVEDRFKMIYAQILTERRWIGGEDVFFTLYDLDADPGETLNVADEHPETFERLQRILWKHRETEREAPAEEEETCLDGGAMQAETEDLLKTLGYL